MSTTTTKALYIMQNCFYYYYYFFFFSLSHFDWITLCFKYVKLTHRPTDRERVKRNVCFSQNTQHIINGTENNICEI